MDNQVHSIEEGCALCVARQQTLLEEFKCCRDAASRYEWLIARGRKMPLLSVEQCTPQLKVPGCQSELFLLATYRQGLLFFQTRSDALIASGMASLLIETYQGLAPEVILKSPFLLAEGLGLEELLSPHRANGFFALRNRIQAYALTYL